MVLNSRVHTMTIAYLILAHQHPVLLARLIRRLFDAGGVVAIHFDRNAGESPVKALQELLGQDFERLVRVERVAVVWGEWSLVEATLNGLEAIARSEYRPDYVCLLSGSDYPVRPLDELQDFLVRNRGKEYIESFSDKEHFWVKTGIQRERYLYRFPFNWGTHPRLFSMTLKLQQLLHWKRHVPAGIDPHFGSQWWVLTWNSCAAILRLCENEKWMQFFKGTWVPDELFFQTLIRNVTEAENIRSHSLTLYQFTDCGTPVVYCNGHEGYLARQNFFFARKISPWADSLRDRLDAIAAGDRHPYRFVDEAIGTRTSEYLDHCRLYGKGLYGKQVIGRAGDKVLGDLSWNRQPYFIVIGFSSSEIQAFQDYLNSLDGVICHGQLFHPGYIDFQDSVDRYAGFSRQDVSLRDNNIQNFLAQLLHEDSERKVGFLVDPDTRQDAISVLVCDPNARVILLFGDPIQAFLESDDGKSIPAEMYDQADAGVLDAKETLIELFVSYYESSKKTLHVLNRLLEENDTGALYLKAGIDPEGTTLTERHLEEFYHNRLSADPSAGGDEVTLQFSTGFEATATYGFLQAAREAVDRCFADKTLDMDKAAMDDKSG